jgi:polyphosphate kinase
VRIEGLLDLAGLRALDALDRPDLVAEPWTPVPPPRLASGRDIFAVLAEGDVLVHHPYESFADSVEAFVVQAAADPAVVAIKQTLYRTGNDSPIVDALIRAARSGKEVTVVVELQARFDERANIAWARALEESGAQVIYGLARLKTHSKISLVLRREGDGLLRYCHIGSGNYNSVTARTYEDVGLLTADPEVGSDVGELVGLLAGGQKAAHFARLVVSPVATRAQIVAAIEAEACAGPDGRIVIKTNGLTDPEVIDALYRASCAGTPIDLIVRGRCCLRPGVPGLSETIRVRSVVGRFLEHSRIFRFGGGPARPLRVSFGSPDLMERNLDRRVEVVVPVDDPVIRDRLVAILDDAVADQANAWELAADGAWVRCDPDDGVVREAFSLQDRCRARARSAWERGAGDGRRGAPEVLAPPVSTTGRATPAAQPLPTPPTAQTEDRPPREQERHPAEGPPGGSGPGWRLARWWRRLLSR